MNLTYIQNIPSQNSRIKILLHAHGTLSRIDYMIGHKISSSKFKKIEIISSMFSNHNSMILEINYKKNLEKNHTNMQRLNNVLLNNQWVNHEIKEKNQ